MSRLPAMPRIDPATLYPSISPAMARAFVLVGAGKPVDPNQVTVTRRGFFHRQLYATTGHANLNFFDQAATDFVTNMPRPGDIAENTGFWLSGISVAFQTGIDAAGARVAGGSQFPTTGGGAATQAEEIRTIAENAHWSLTIGQKIVAEGYGLTQLPQAGGLTASMSVATTAAATTINPVNLNNGDAHAQNLYGVPKFGVVAGRGIKFVCRWRSLLTATTAFYLMPILHGTLIQPANN